MRSPAGVMSRPLLHRDFRYKTVVFLLNLPGAGRVIRACRDENISIGAEFQALIRPPCVGWSTGSGSRLIFFAEFPPPHRLFQLPRVNGKQVLVNRRRSWIDKFAHGGTALARATTSLCSAFIWHPKRACVFVRKIRVPICQFRIFLGKRPLLLSKLLICSCQRID